MSQFSAAHLLAIATTALVAVAVVWAARSRPGAGRAVAPLLALGVLAAYVIEHVTYVIRGAWSPAINLPLHLTDAVTLVTVAALLMPHRRLLVELVYFWSLSASLQAVLTPDLGVSFPDVLYLTFFVTHSGAIVAACLLVFGCGLTPRRGAVWRVLGVSIAFTTLAAMGTVLTGGNYMYLRHKPSGGSLLDFFGPWPWYIAGGALVAVALFLVLARLADVQSLSKDRRSTGETARAPE